MRERATDYPSNIAAPETMDSVSEADEQLCLRSSVNPPILLRKRDVSAADLPSPPLDSNLDHRLKFVLRFKIGGAWGAMMGLPSGRT